MPKKERKVTCPRCHRSITKGELAQHMREHKGRIPSHLRITHTSQSQLSTMSAYICDCGLKFETREGARKHLKGCSGIKSSPQICSLCSTESRLLMPYKDLQLCPTCAVGFFETKKIYGASVINHMGDEYEDIFRNKVESFLSQLNVKNLPELGTDVVTITFSEGFNPFNHFVSPRKELVFIFAKTDQIREMERRIFTNVINHELFHGYITHKLGLGISDKLNAPFSFLEGCAAMLAEDVQLERIAVRNDVRMLLEDEITRETIYFEKIQPVPNEYWNTRSAGEKILAMFSVTWTYAVISWFAKSLAEPEARKRAESNLALVHPHFVKYGFPYLKDSILRLFHEKIAETEEESEGMVKSLLGAFDKYSDEHGLMLY